MRTIRILILMAIPIFWLSCKRTSLKESDAITAIISGQYAKVWIWKSEDTLDCHCYYEIIFKTGKMRHVRRDKYSGVFIDYFNNLSVDALNNEDRWYYKNDTLSLKGFKYKLIGVSEKKDTIVIESFYSSKRYYLIDSKLMAIP